MKTRPHITLSLIAWKFLPLLLLACLATPTADVRAQSPDTLAGRTLQLTISSGSSPLASSGSYRFLPSALDNAYAIVPISGSIAAGFGTHTYTKTGLNTASLSITDNLVPGTLTVNCTFSTTNSGSYALTRSGGGSQSGTFVLFSGTAPASLAGYTISVTITSGASPYASSGSYQFLPAAFGSAYTIDGSPPVADSSGTYSYTRIPTMSGYISYDDSLGGSGFTDTLSFDSATTGTLFLRKSGGGGYQTGTFSMVSPTAPNISAHPQSQTVLEGQAVSFNVTATGTAPLAYQWRKDGTNLVGATSASYNLPTVETNHAGSYTVVVSNTAGSVTSAPPAVLTVSAITPGAVVAWGAGKTSTGTGPEFGQSIVPAGLSEVTAIAAGYYHTVALKNDGTVVAWGAGGGGQSGNPHYGQASVPAGLSGVATVALGVYHTVALKRDGTMVAWGDNSSGQTAIPTELNGVTAIAAGFYHTVAAKSDGTVVAWGANGNGQTTVPSSLNAVVAVAAGNHHTVALKNNGTVVAWGGNLDGQTTVPAGLNGVSAIAAGYSHSAALKTDGTVVVWGRNFEGQSNVPVGLSGVVAISAGSYFVVALKSDGTVVAWGHNSNGQVTIPGGLKGVTAIAAGYVHSVALVGVPTIVTTATANNLTLRWLDTTAGFRVESALSLLPQVTWSNEPGIFQTNGGSISIVLPITGTKKFYRLTKP